MEPKKYAGEPRDVIFEKKVEPPKIEITAKTIDDLLSNCGPSYVSSCLGFYTINFSDGSRLIRDPRTLENFTEQTANEFCDYVRNMHSKKEKEKEKEKTIHKQEYFLQRFFEGLYCVQLVTETQEGRYFSTPHVKPIYINNEYIYPQKFYLYCPLYTLGDAAKAVTYFNDQLKPKKNNYPPPPKPSKDQYPGKESIKIDFSKYQTEAAKFALPQENNKTAVAVWAMGLAGESGEVVEHIKKWIGHNKDLDLNKVAEELGDVLWYIAAMATQLNIDLNNIAVNSITKIEKRYPDMQKNQQQ